MSAASHAATPPPFTVVPHVAPGRCKLVVRGELDIGSAPLLEEAISRCGRHGRALQVDLARVTFIDSTGIRLLVTTRRRADRDGFSLKVTLPRHDSARRALDLCRVADLLTAPAPAFAAVANAS